MNRDEVLKGIQSVANEHLEIKGTLEPKMNILHDAQLDSLDQLTLVVELENYFAIAFDEGDESEVVTIDDLIDLILKTLKAPRNPEHD